MVLSKKRITKALIRLRGCAGWSAPVLFANPEDRFSRVEAHIIFDIVYPKKIEYLVQVVADCTDNWLKPHPSADRRHRSVIYAPYRTVVVHVSPRMLLGLFFHALDLLFKVCVI